MQVSAQEHSHAAEVALWATAVAAADGVHSSKQVQEGVIGACSTIRRPCPDLPALLETALPDQPVERVLPCYRSCLACAHTSDTLADQHRCVTVIDWQCMGVRTILHIGSFSPPAFACQMTSWQSAKYSAVYVRSSNAVYVGQGNSWCILRFVAITITAVKRT